METKRSLVRPTPEKVRAKLPRLAINPQTGEPVSDSTIFRIYHTMCYDENEDDPWVYAYSRSKDYLSNVMKQNHHRCAVYYKDNYSAAAWSNQVAIDPCITILPNTQAVTDDQKSRCYVGQENDVS